MRLAGFYGFTAINLMAIQDSTDVISYVQNLNSTLNDQILRDLSKEFYFLGTNIIASANKAPFERQPSILIEDVQLPFSNAYVPKLTHAPL